MLRNKPNGMGGWRVSAFNAQRLLASKLMVPDTSASTQAIISRAAADSHVHEGAKRRRRLGGKP